MANLDFLKGFEKDIEKIDGIGTSSQPPRYWYSTGNFALNKVMSGGFMRGIPQGRITDIAGPSGAGKSFLAANLLVAAQKAGAFCVVIDSEGALDDEFMTKIGVNVTKDYKYFDVTTIPQVTRIVSALLKHYSAAAKDGDTPQLFILIDSLDMLITETELEHFEKGDQKGDQGQKNKQLKQMLRTFVQGIKQLDITMVCTSQVYKNQDLKNGEGLWIVSDAVKYACSQILLVQKRKLRDKGSETGEALGVRIIAEGYKTRFTKPFQKVDVEVPYDTGMDPNSGLQEAAVAAGVLKRKGSYYYIEGGSGELFYWKDVGEHIAELLTALDKSEATVDVTQGEDIEIDTETETTAEVKARRKAKVKSED